MRFTKLYLQASGESYEICTDTEAGTLASRHANRRGDQVENRKDSRRNERQRGDLVDRQGLPGDKKRGASYNETLNQVFDRTIDNFSDVHVCSIFRKKKFCILRNLKIKLLHL